MKQLFKIALLSGTMLAATSIMSFANIGEEGFGVIDPYNSVRPEPVDNIPFYHGPIELHESFQNVMWAGGSTNQVIISFRKDAEPDEPGSPGPDSRDFVDPVYENHFCKMLKPRIGENVSRKDKDFYYQASDWDNPDAADSRTFGDRAIVELKWYDHKSKELPSLLTSQGITRLKKGEGRFVLDVQDYGVSNESRIVFPIEYRGIRSLAFWTGDEIFTLDESGEPERADYMRFEVELHLESHDVTEDPVNAPYLSDWEPDDPAEWEFFDEELYDGKYSEDHRIQALLDFGRTLYKPLTSYSEVGLNGIEIIPLSPGWTPEEDVDYHINLGLICFVDYLGDNRF